MRTGMKIAAGVGGGLLATGLIVGTVIGVQAAPKARIGTAYAAQAACVQRYINHTGDRGPDLPDDPMAKYLSTGFNVPEEQAEGSIFGLYGRTSYYTEGVGCTVADQRPEYQQTVPGIDQRVQEVIDGGTIGHPEQPLEDRARQRAVEKAVRAALEVEGARGIVVVKDGKLIHEDYAKGFDENTPQLGWSMTKSVANVLLGRIAKEDSTFNVQGSALRGVPWASGVDEEADVSAASGGAGSGASGGAGNGTGAGSANSSDASAAGGGAGNGAGAGSANGSDAGAAGRTTKADITFSDLLRMQSGLEWEETYSTSGDVTHMLFNAPNMGEYVASKKLEHAPGTYREYSTGSTTLACAAAQVKSPVAAKYGVAVAWEMLFKRVGMASAMISPDAQGSLTCGSSAYATPRDWAKLGQFVMDDGRVGDRQLLPPNWMKASLTENKVDTVQPNSDGSDPGHYGSGWWLNSANTGEAAFGAGADGTSGIFDGATGSKDDRTYGDLPTDMFWADGHDGQFMVIVPSENLIVVRQGFSPGVSIDSSKTLDIVRAAIGKATQS